MSFKNIVPISEARKNIFKIAEEVQEPDNYYVLTEHGRPKVVIMSADDFESWQETVEVLSDPKTIKAMDKVEKDLATGTYQDYPTLEEVFAEQGFVFADKKNKYEVSNKTRTKGSKRAKKTTS